MNQKLLHISSETVRLPLPGVDPHADRLVANGEIRDIKTVTLPGGTQVRLGRTIGATHYRPKAKE